MTRDARVSSSETEGAEIELSLKRSRRNPCESRSCSRRHYLQFPDRDLGGLGLLRSMAGTGHDRSLMPALRESWPFLSFQSKSFFFSDVQSNKGMSSLGVFTSLWVGERDSEVETVENQLLVRIALI